MPRINKTHYLIYFAKSSGDYIMSSPKAWAHANHHHFDTSSGEFPTVEKIENYLIENYGFEKTVTEQTVVLFNYNLDIPKSNGQAFI